MTGSPRILVLDDDPAICALVRRCLAMGGFQVDTVQDGAAMRRILRQHPVDLVVLDLNLRGEDGLDCLRELRASGDTPVIILTARGEHVDRVVGLELGADDYIPKPFEPRELLARVRTVLRRAAPRPKRAAAGASRVLNFGDWRLDLDARALTRADGTPVPLTTAQFDILVLLASHPNRVLSRDQILDLARDRTTAPFDRSIDVHISQIRRKLEKDPRHPEIIKTIYGAGYVFTLAPRQE